MTKKEIEIIKELYEDTLKKIDENYEKYGWAYLDETAKTTIEHIAKKLNIKLKECKK